MVFIGGWRTPRPGYGPYRRPGYGPYQRPGYGPYGRPGYGGNSCLRDICLLQTGCCLAEMVGCGPQLTLLGPSIVRRSWSAARHPVSGQSTSQSRWVRGAVAAIRLYQQEISAKRTRPCCRYSPSCSEYAREALETHGLRAGLGLATRRLLRCRPGTLGGADPVPPRG